MYRDFNNTTSDKKITSTGYEELISEDSKKIILKLLEENPKLETIFSQSEDIEHARKSLREWAMDHLRKHPVALDYYNGDITGREAFGALDWQDFATIRLLDYINHEGNEYEDLNLGGRIIINAPVRLLWLAIKEEKGGGTVDFFRDMLHLFRQFSGTKKRHLPDAKQVSEWMNRHPSGLDPEVIEQRKKNRDRIIRLFIKKIDAGDIQRRKYTFEPGMSFWDKYKKVLEWWNDHIFHLQFAARTPERLNRMLGRTLDEETMSTLLDAQDTGIPFFVNPYYLSLLNVHEDDNLHHSDHAIRDYVFVSKELVNEFGKIVAWEKEDVVEPGKPNAAGWILPHRRNIHRRYPEVAILIPDTTGRACGGLCVSCQRMYDFQDGHLNFDLEELKPVETWWERLPKLLNYFEEDAQLRDILITGGDALMSSDKSLQRILDEVYQMALRKKEANGIRPDGENFAEMQRIRLGTRLPVYLPQRITDSLIAILRNFKEKAARVGFKQFVIQTHFESAMEVTPEAANGIRKLVSAGWIVTNQLVFTAAASRRGHTAKLRKVLNDIGVLTYYTFTVKGYQENSFTFANNARAVQEQLEEKYIGEVPKKYHELIRKFPEHAEDMVENIESLRRICDIPFLSTDRNVMNLPGVGKSLTFRTIGITNDGRRILEFGFDHTRSHSPIINKMGKMTIIESKSIAGYLKRLEQMGEDLLDYRNVWGYSLGETEPRMPVYDYPENQMELTDEFTNLKV
ncbi:MAG: KamA family protein [Bacteroidales bacterium]|nr:KamA family protein [Bacteroidales bacterium]